MSSQRTTGLKSRLTAITIILGGGVLILLGGCLRPYELKAVPPANLLSPYKVIELKSNTFTIEFGQQHLIAKGAPPPGLILGDTVQAMSNCWDDLWVGCRGYLELMLPNGKAYHYWLVQSRKSN